MTTICCKRELQCNKTAHDASHSASLTIDHFHHSTVPSMLLLLNLSAPSFWTSLYSCQPARMVPSQGSALWLRSVVVILGKRTARKCGLLLVRMNEGHTFDERSVFYFCLLEFANSLWTIERSRTGAPVYRQHVADDRISAQRHLTCLTQQVALGSNIGHTV